MKQKDFLINAVLTSGITLLMSTFGILFRTYASNRVGSETMGLLQLVLSVYYPACTLASSGIYVASTRLCTEALARRDRPIRQILNRCIVYALFFGTAAFCALFFGANFIAERLLNHPSANLPLKILAFGVPFLSVANALQGFFLSLRSALYASTLQVVEDVSKIAATMLLFFRFLENGPTAALCALVGGMAAGEIISCVFGFVLYQTKAQRLPIPTSKNPNRIFPELLHVALPCAFSAYLRSGMGMAEELLVPQGLNASGLTEEQTLAVLGKFEGMALPLLLFPAAFLAVVSKLLVPEITATNAKGNSAQAKQTAESILRWTLTYATFVALFASVFGKELGIAVYRDETCGAYIALLAPLVPILYCDRVTDGIMKGYNRHLETLRINMTDTALRTAGAIFLLPKTGIVGYVLLLMGGSVFNFALSFRALNKTTGIRLPLKEGILQPILTSLAAILPLLILQHFINFNVWIKLIFALSVFLALTAIFSKEEASCKGSSTPHHKMKEWKDTQNKAA